MRKRVAWGVVTAGMAASASMSPTPAYSQTPTTNKPSDVAKAIDAFIENRRSLQPARIGILIRDLATGATLYERDAQGRYNIASNAKIITAAAALSRLGPAHQFRTSLHVKKVDANGVATGPLYVQGTGDPSVGTPELVDLARQVRLSGVKRISSGIALDDSHFDQENLPPHFDEQPNSAAAYRAPIGALSINFNSYTIVVQPAWGKSGLARVAIDPDSGYFRTTNEVETVPRGRTRITVKADSRKGILELKIGGQIHADAGVRRFRRRVPDANRYFAHTLRAILVRQGVRVGRSIARKRVPARAEVIASVWSPPVATLVRGLGKFSNNYVAEMLLKAIGARWPRPTQGTWSNSLAAVNSFLEQDMKLTSGSFRYGNGSGLFDASDFSPQQIVKVLEAGYRDFRYGPDLVSSLAIAGRDGTLRRRMRQGPARGLVRAKTGTLAAVTTLAGYVARNAAQPVAFAIFINDLPPKRRARLDARQLQDEIVALVANHLTP